MQIVFNISHKELTAIARRLNAEARGEGYYEEDGQVCDRVLTRIAGKAALLNGIVNKETVELIGRDYREFCRGRRRKA
jgi:hypothetical protein